MRDPNSRSGVHRNSDSFPPTAEGRELAKHFGCQFIETSAKQRLNVDEAFSNLVREIRKYNKVRSNAPHCMMVCAELTSVRLSFAPSRSRQQVAPVRPHQLLASSRLRSTTMEGAAAAVWSCNPPPSFLMSLPASPSIPPQLGARFFPTPTTLQFPFPSLFRAT